MGPAVLWDMEDWMTGTGAALPVERVRLGARIEKCLVKVLKGLAEFEGVSLGQLRGKIVPHSSEPMPGEEGKWAASPHGQRALPAIAQLRQVYGLAYDVQASRQFREGE